MKYFPTSALVLTLLATSLSGCTEPGPSSADIAASGQQETTRFNEFLAKAWEERLAGSPELRSRLGQRIDYEKWDDLSDTAADNRQYQIRLHLAELPKFDYTKLDSAARLSYELFEEEGNRRLEQYRWRHHHYLFDQQNGLQAEVPAFLINVHQIGDAADAEAYIARLRGIGPLLQQAEERLSASETLGVIPPRFVFPLVATDIRNLLTGRPFDRSPTDSPLFKDFKDKVEALDLPQARRAELINAAGTALTEVVKPAYDALSRRLRVLEKQATDDAGAWKLPNGIQYYRAMLRWYTTADLTPEELHELGLAEVTRVQTELKALMPRLGFSGTLTELFPFMSQRPESHYPDTDAGRSAYLMTAEARIEAIRQRLGTHFTVTPQDSLIVKRVEPFREQSAGKAFYTRAAEDGSRPATYFVNLSRMNEMPKYELEPLAYHEGIPGHHLQRSLTRALTGLPEFRKRFPATAFTEGWGLYAERLAAEMGGYTDAQAEYGRLVMELNRAVRLVVDTGLHAKRWTREQAIQYHLGNTPMSRPAATKAVDRYIVYPGQGAAYIVGLLRLVQLREHAARELKDEFDIREFHDIVLGSGPLSLNALGRLVNAYIERHRTGPSGG